MRLKIRTHLLAAFGTMLLLLASLAFVAVDRTAQIGRVANDLNGRVVDKTRIAADLVNLGQQLRTVDPFLLKAADGEEAATVRQTIGDRLRAIDLQTSSFGHYVDNPMERRLLINLERSRSEYLKVQEEILAKPPADRAANASSYDAALSTAFDGANRQARGLSHLTENEARATRDQVAQIAADAQRTVLAVGSLAVAVGLIIVALLVAMVFRPLAQVTRSLLALSQGRLDVTLGTRGRGGEIDDMVGALEVFRTNAVALTQAHEETKAAHQRADALARHDALTGLPNRRVLSSAIADALVRSERRGAGCAVLVLDLDRFKPINDIFGHGAGDKVLCEIASRLGATVRPGEMTARLGGDEFAVVLEFEPGSDAPHRLAKRLIASITAPIPIEGRSVSVGTSVGIALWPSDGTDAEGLLHAADLAMFKAKRDERGSFRFFEPEMDIQLRTRADLEGRIRAAIEQGDIRPHYQPLVDLKRERIIGFEVLARWHDGAVTRPPSDFIQVADDAGLIPPLTFSVLRQACREAKAWPDHLTLALNVTPAQIADSQLPVDLLRLLAEEDFRPERLELEVTENALIGDVSSAKAVMATLRQHGVKISLDDFGTGYSSLHHLRDLKFDKIKIDRSFIQSMLDNAESTKIVETILGLGRSLGIFTIAEGIEDSAHLQSLLRQGCELGQGYHFGRPMAAESVTALLTDDPLRAAA